MKVKSVEIIVKEVIELDRKTDRELEEIRREIQTCKNDFKSAMDQAKADAEQKKIDQGKALYDEMMGEAIQERNAILMKSKKQTVRMEKAFNRKKEAILMKALKTTSIGEWDL